MIKIIRVNYLDCFCYFYRYYVCVLKIKKKLKKPVLVFSYSINNKSNSEIDIHIDGDIVDASTQEFLKAYFGDTTSTSYKSFRNSMNALKEIDTYNVIINSSGGHVGDAMAIHDLITELQNNGKTVNTIGRGIVASSATLILLAGKNPEMSANSWFMMHSVSGGIYGNVDMVENYATTMRKFNNEIRDLYASKSGMRPEEITKLMDNETWLTAKEAKGKGLVAIVTGDIAFENKIPAEQWSFSNNAVLNSYNASVKPENNEVMSFLKNLKTELMNAVKGIPSAKDNQELVNQIADAIGKPFEGLEVAINEAVKNAVDAMPKPATIDIDPTIIKAAVDVATADLVQKVNDLEQDIVDKIGGESQAGKQKDPPAVIGKFDN